MDVYDFLNTFSDLSAVVISIFDCASEEVVWNSVELDDAGIDAVTALQCSDFASYEVQGADLFKNRDGLIQLEINIDMGDETTERRTEQCQ